MKLKMFFRPVQSSWVSTTLLGLCLGVGCNVAGPGSGNTNSDKTITTPLAVIGTNDLGMHCMNSDYSEISILPPFNTVHAQVIDRGGDPRIVTSEVEVRYAVLNNTHSADKTNFWDFPQALLGSPAPNIGLTGNGLSGVMTATGDNDWSATGIPVTPIDDQGQPSPYNVAKIEVYQSGALVAETEAVVPVSSEMSCDNCHNTPGISMASDILQKHDAKHGTDLESQKPVLCAGCHSDNALGLGGVVGVKSLSAAMHSAHADRMSALSLEVDCYACHPGVETQCLRDVHLANGLSCADCHDDMAAVGSSDRNPWVDQPRCGDCHDRQGYEYEQSGKLYRQSKGHMGVHCMACHGSPHAITPTVTALDNAQAIALQGHAGPLDNCALCHQGQPDEGFFHRLSE